MAAEDSSNHRGLTKMACAWRALSVESAHWVTTASHPSLIQNSPPRSLTSPAPPHISVSMQFAVKQRRVHVLHGTRCSDRVKQRTFAAPTPCRRGFPEWAYGIDTSLVQSPEHGWKDGRGGAVLPLRRKWISLELEQNFHKFPSTFHILIFYSP